MRIILGMHSYIFFYKINSNVILSIYLQRQLRDNIIRSQTIDKQQQMTRLFEMLMEGVERNLLTKSRDRYELF